MCLVFQLFILEKELREKIMTYDLTVIIPVYNTEKYLRRCLESIVNQDDIEQCSIKVICIMMGVLMNLEK